MQGSFAASVRDELAGSPLGEAHCRVSELSALTQGCASLALHGHGLLRVLYRTESTATVRRVQRLLRAVLGIRPAVRTRTEKRFGGRRVFILSVEGEDARRLLETLHMLARGESGALHYRGVPRRALTRICCRRAFVRGAFLACGTLSDPASGYQAFIRVQSPAMRHAAVRALDKCDIAMTLGELRGESCLYTKNGETVARLLALMGANRAVLSLESTRVEKQMRGQANRAYNCDTHNLSRQLSAGERQARAITILSKAMALSALPPKLSETARVRLANPDASLEALGQMLSPPIGKSGVNHRLEKLCDMAEDVLREHPELNLYPVSGETLKERLE